MPPKGESWFIAPKIDVPAGFSGAVILAAFGRKPPAERDRLVYALVNVFDVGLPGLDNRDAVVRAATEALKKGTARQRVLDLNVAPASSPAPNCARYRRTAEMDANSILVTTGVMCAHPHWSRYVLDIHYGERYKQGLQPLPLEADVETFLGGVIFTPQRPIVE